jgi:hypothetical protein
MTEKGEVKQWLLNLEVDLRSAKFTRGEFLVPCGLPSEIYSQIMEIIAAHCPVEQPTSQVFSPEEVDCLNEYQLAGVMHPFTCQCGCDLVATVRGWICCKCDYTQDWAHYWMKNRKWKSVAGPVEQTAVAKLRKRAAYLRKCFQDKPASMACLADELERQADEIERDCGNLSANEPMVKTDAAPGGDV